MSPSTTTRCEPSSGSIENRQWPPVWPGAGTARTDTPTTEQQRFKNPLGLEVQSYRADLEVTQ